MANLIDSAQGLFYRIAASGYVPAAWFRPVPLPSINKARKTGKLKLEIVVHCWRYAHYLVYQLSSLVNYPTDKFDIVVTVFHADEDVAVSSVLEFFGAMQLPGVRWNWQSLPKQQLFRRSIGRNRAAKASVADWVWFADCDILFHEGCLDALADELQGRDDTLVHPRRGLGTKLLADDDAILERGRGEPAVLDIPLDQFVPYGGDRKKAKGPYQITHGDIARALGYCDNIRIYQQPEERWRKTYEDRVFRWLIGSHGTPLEVPGACQIRHIVKGRYKKDSAITKVRQQIRKSQDGK